MKILSIRIRNLGSYAGEHHLDLAGPDLVGVGILPIVGPTGAGKSTLLDAITLCFFDRLARLPSSKSSARIEEGLSASDPRTLLRSDAGEGFAEVSFRGVDGRLYRARWEVRRSRSRPGGKLQGLLWSLVDVEADRRVAERKKKEVKAAIEARIGFTFEELQRAVVIPQGRFAELLRAPADARATLLEKITGTEIYGEISKLAHQRMAVAQEKNAAARAAIPAEAPSTPNRLRVAAIEQAQHDLSGKEEALLAHKQWHARAEELQSAREVAEQALQTIVGQRREQEELREAFQQFEPLEVLREPLASRERIEGEARAQRDLVTHLEVQEDARRREADEATGLRSDASARREGVQRASELVEAECVWAGECDAKLEALRDSELRAASDAVAAQRECCSAAQKVEGLGRRVEGARSAEVQEHRWCTEHRVDLELAGAWSDLESLFDRSERALHRCRRVQVDLEARQQERGAARRKFAAAEQSLHRADEDLATLDEERSGVVRRCEDLDGLDAERTDLDPREATCRSARALQQEMTAAVLEVRTAEADLGRTRDALQAGRTRLVEAGDAHRSAADDRVATARLLQRARAQESLEERRAVLVPGEPCPLCGAREHPFAGGAPLASRVSVLERELQDTETREAKAATELGAARTHADHTQERHQQGRQRIEEARRRLDGALERRQSLPVSWPQDPHALALHLEALERALREERESLRLRSQERDALRQRRRGLDQQARALSQGLGECERRVAQLRERLHGLGQQVGRGEEAQRSAVREYTDVSGELKRALSRLGLLDETRDALSARVQAAAMHQAALEKAQRERADLERALSDAKGIHEKRARSATTLAAARSRSEAQRARMELQRASLLQGRSVAEVRSSIRARVREALESERSLGDRLAEAHSGLAATRAQLHERRTRLRQLERQLVIAEERLDKALAGRSREDAEAGLALWPSERVRRTRDVLQQGDEELLQARGALEARRTDERHHQRTARLSLEQPSLRTALEQHANALALLREEREVLHESATAYERWKRECEQATAHAMKVEDQEARWLELGELIGAAGGQKLRAFAQGLTLELLVQRANAQLADLAPRFALRRMGDLDLAVVDHDDAGEVRGVHSLSGGETFLVSLALALGLSSLFGDRVQVGSLFIDEGFGSLDLETLDAALGALEALHARGRQVVLISHVQGLAERFDAVVQIRREGPGRSSIEIERKSPAQSWERAAE